MTCDKPLISVIVPVYNVEEYLNECIYSIINQTLKNIEIILVDDGSTDSSGQICDHYAASDKRIKVIHKANEGLSSARNDGIDASEAQLIMFVDGDDWVAPCFCESPYNAMKDNNADLILFAYNRVNDQDYMYPMETHIDSGKLSKEEALYYNTCYWDAAWLCLYNKHLFDGLRFPVGKYYEDVGIIHRLIYNAKSVFLINEHLYNYRVNRVGSITNSPETRNHPDKIKMHILRIEDLCVWKYEDIARRNAITLLIMYKLKEDDREFLVNLVRNGSIFANGLNWKQRALSLSLRLSSQLFDFICITSGKRLNDGDESVMDRVGLV